MRFCKAASIKEPWTIVSLERAYKVLCVIFLGEYWRSGLEIWSREVDSVRHANNEKVVWAIFKGLFRGF